MIGPGKYDALCTLIRERTQARAVLLIVLDGEYGNGFSCQSDSETLRALPDILEQTAARIRREGPYGPPLRG
jgi:hypothetical protein